MIKLQFLKIYIYIELQTKYYQVIVLKLQQMLDRYDVFRERIDFMKVCLFICRHFILPTCIV